MAGRGPELMWRVDYENIVRWYHVADVIHEEPRYFRFFITAWLSAWWYCQNRPWGAAHVSKRKVPALPSNGDPYRALPAGE